MTVQQLAEAIRRARDYSGEPLEVVLVTRAVACPRCGRDRCQPLLAATSPEFGARRCTSCGCAFRLVVATSADVVAAVSAAAGIGASAAPAPPVTAAPAAAAPADDEHEPDGPAWSAASHQADARELEAAAELDDDDLVEASRALAGWRVRLATVRTRKLLDDEFDPRPEDLALLARAVLGGWG